MDINDFKLGLVDHSHAGGLRWKFRRFGIGTILSFYLMYAVAFFFQLAFPEHDLFELGDGSDTWSIPDAITVATFGFIGGVFFVSRTFIRTTERWSENGPLRFDLPVSWYLLRPMLGSLTSIFLYYTVLAGQLVFFNNEQTQDADSINIYTLSLLAIIAGIFTEEAFEKLHSVAKTAFRVHKAD
ncbi:MAG: hypothetical protein AAGC73_09045 [Verrucomicrobiota bacterium]